jgi:ABC-type transport system involved in multi-copper enzyme maturation permease subunit
MRWLMRKDSRELLASRAFWFLLIVVGFLVGQGFQTATGTYAELSGAGGGLDVLAQGLSPLDGIVVPTLSAYDLAATLLLPFVVIRLLAAERQNGGMKLLLQAPVSRLDVVLSKTIVLIGAWVVAMIPAFLALLLWRFAGGHLGFAETANVILGHLVIAGIAIAISLLAASIARSAASAAIVALTFTLGMWAIDFIAAVHGGWMASIARYTPSAVMRTFQHGLLQASTIGVALCIVVAAIAGAATLIELGAPLRRMAARIATIAVVATAVAALVSTIRWSADVSEDRRNSFPVAHERALAAIRDPVHLEVRLAAEDPRRTDLEREVLSKLRRSMRVKVDYVDASTTGLTSRSQHYGEMVYSLHGRSDTTRSVIVPVVLEIIYDLAGVKAPEEAADSSSYPGYPQKSPPRFVPWIFYLAWPLLVLAAWRVTSRR